MGHIRSITRPKNGSLLRYRNQPGPKDRANTHGLLLGSSRTPVEERRTSTSPHLDHVAPKTERTARTWLVALRRRDPVLGGIKHIGRDREQQETSGSSGKWGGGDVVGTSSTWRHKTVGVLGGIKHIGRDREQQETSDLYRLHVRRTPSRPARASSTPGNRVGGKVDNRSSAATCSAVLNICRASNSVCSCSESRARWMATRRSRRVSIRAFHRRRVFDVT